MSASKFSEYWRDLKLNHPDKYAERLKKNRERIRAYRERIYADKKLHEEYKADNRATYKRRFDRMKEEAKAAALAEIAKSNVVQKKQNDDTA